MRVDEDRQVVGWDHQLRRPADRLAARVLKVEPFWRSAWNRSQLSRIDECREIILTQGVDEKRAVRVGIDKYQPATVDRPNLWWLREALRRWVEGAQHRGRDWRPESIVNFIVQEPGSRIHRDRPLDAVGETELGWPNSSQLVVESLESESLIWLDVDSLGSAIFDPRTENHSPH